MGMKTATSADYPAIARLLNAGSSCVLVSVAKSNAGSYSLLTIATGPFTATKEGVSGVGVGGVHHTLRLSEGDCHVELKKKGGHWYAPEEGRLFLEIPE